MIMMLITLEMKLERPSVCVVRRGEESPLSTLALR
jgi:hypothetical protein